MPRKRSATRTQTRSGAATTTAKPEPARPAGSPASPAPRSSATAPAQPATPAPQRYGPPPFSFTPGQWAFGLTLVLLAVIGVAAVVAGMQANANSSAGQISNTTPLAAGKPAPDFSLPAQQGGTVSLSQYRGGGSNGGGKVVVLEFFAPWCPHCQAEVATLNKIQQQYASQGVQVLSVTASPFGLDGTSPISMAEVRKFVNQYHVAYPALLDTSLKVGNAYGVYAYPQIFVIDRNGDITWNNGHNGETSFGTLKTRIEEALKKPLSTATPTSSAAPTATPTAHK